MIDTEYLTQILFRSTKNEDPVVFFRRVQKKIWSMLPLFFPEIDADGKGILDALSFDQFSRDRSFHVGLGANDNVSGRNLETAKLCSHALTISLSGESAQVKGKSDNTYKTDICIETAKAFVNRSAAVRFSYVTNILYQPFAGFYPLAEKKFETPKIVESLLSLSNSEAQFMPRIDCINGAPPKYKYPICRKVITVKDQKIAEDFLSRLKDRARPIPFLVYMGNSGRMRTEADLMMPSVYSKAWVYVVERAELLKGMINDIIPGIDLNRDFKTHACRLFFPFGSYIPHDFANPAYPIKLFGRRRYRGLVLNGLLRFFDIEEPGWRRTQRDIHMIQLDLQAERTLALKEDEVNDCRVAVAKKQEVINVVLDARKREKDQIEAERKALREDRELFEGENKRLEEQNRKLLSVNGELKGQNEALRQQLKTWQESGQQREFKLGVESCYPNEVYDHLIEMLRMIDGNIPAEQLRRRQIYDAIMKANPSSGELQMRKDGVAAIVRNKSEISASDIKAFERLGFTYSKDGPHHKFSMGSFCMIMPCTGSDKGRGWKNSIRDFNRNFFIPSKGDV